MEYFILLAIIGILIAYIVIRETIVQNQIKELEEEEKKPIYLRNNFVLERKIKEVITSDQTR